MNEDDEIYGPDPDRYLMRPDALRAVPGPEMRDDPGIIGSILEAVSRRSEANDLAMRRLEDEARGITVPYEPGQPSISSREPSYFDRLLSVLPEGVEESVRDFGRSMRGGPAGVARNVAGYMSSPEFLADLETGGLASGVKMAASGFNRLDKLPPLGKMWDNVLNVDDAMEMAVRGDHIRPARGGGFEGAPESIRSIEDIDRVREEALESMRIGALGFNWYDRARDFGAKISGYNPATMLPDSKESRLASMFARGGAVHSSNTSPIEEVRKYVLQHNTRALTGTEPTGGLYQQPVNTVKKGYRNVPDAGLEIDPSAVTHGRKTGAYAQAKDPNFPREQRVHSVNDIWQGRGLGFGKDFKGSFTDRQHSYLAGETLAIADMANKRGIGSDVAEIPEGFKWDVDSTQGAIWVGERFKAAKRENLEAIEKAIAEGKEVPAILSDEDAMEYALSGVDQLGRHYVDDTMEFVTGKASGHLAGMSDAPESLRREYTDMMARAYMDSPSGDLRDPVYDALDLYQYPAAPITGRYVNSEGQLEVNPGFVARPVGAIQNKVNPRGAWMLNQPDAQAVGIASNLRGLLTAQEAVARSKVTPNTIDRVRLSPVGAGFRYTGDDLDAARQAFEDRGLGVVQVDDALNVGDFMGERPSKEIVANVNAAMEGLSGKADPGIFESFYEEIPWSPEQGTGQASRAVFERIEGYGEGLMNPLARIDQGRLRQSIDTMNEIDRQIAEANDMPIREDLIRLREMIRDVGIEEVARYIKETGGAGLPVAAALVPSLSYLLEERESPVR